MAQSRNTPSSGKNAKSVRTGFSSTRDDPYRWAGRVGVGEGVVQLAQMRGRGWVAQRGNIGRGGNARANGDLRPEAPPQAKRRDDYVR